MKNEEFVYLFKKNCEYYDKEQKELKAILSLFDFKKSNKLIDIGAGIGRLAIPLSNHLRVTAIDTNKALFNQIKEPTIEVVHGKIEEFYPKEKFDYALIAWPSTLNYTRIFKHIRRNILKEDGKLLVIKSLEHDLKNITKKIFPEMFGQSKGFLEVLPDFFRTENERIIKTEWEYPNSDGALKLIILELEAFYDKKVDDEQIEIIKNFIRKHKKSGKVYLNAKLKILLCSQNEKR